MSPVRCLIIEDEPLALERTRAYVERVPYLTLLGSFENALEGLTFLREHEIDLLFLDIHLDELSGIELLESTRIECRVIITTAYPEYALKGYELSVTDYLLKPFNFSRFLAAVEKVRAELTTSAPPRDNYLFVKTEHRLERVEIGDILFIEGMGDYRRIHTTGGRIMTLQTFRQLSDQLPAHQICRVHKSYMVGIANIDSVARGRIAIGKHEVPISETYRAAFLAIIGQR